MKQYDELDRRIIKAIARGRCTHSALVADNRVFNEARHVLTLPHVTDYRIIERRLQALRKAGRIAYADRAWSVVETA